MSNNNMGFLQVFLASLLAIVVAGALAFTFLIMVAAAFMAVLGEPAAPKVAPGSVLKIDLAERITDSPPSSPFRYSGAAGLKITVDRSKTILQAANAIDDAAYDRNIKGVYINLSGGGAISTANIEELRRAIVHFRGSGKWVVAYGDSYSQWDYYLASAADKVFLNPMGEIDWRGLASHVVFYKGLLDKLGVRPEVLRHGSYKAAVEPFIMEKMSPENRQQMSILLESVWKGVLTDISVSRGIDREVLSVYATELSARNAENALEYGLVDALLYEDQVMEVLGRAAGSLGVEDAVKYVTGEIPITEIETVAIAGPEESVAVAPAEHGMALPHQEQAPVLIAEGAADTAARRDGEFPWITQLPAQGEEWLEVTGDTSAHAGEAAATELKQTAKYKDPAIITLGDYISTRGGFIDTGHRDKIAVVYADGEIYSGKSADGIVGSETLVERLARARKDKNTKAVVLRVNSPGGSALAAEVIWREAQRLKDEKPLVVSMGATAASGGYYIAAPADHIMADRATITGSIGVFGLMVDVSRGLKDKLGVTVDVVRTNPSADIGSPFRGLYPRERQVAMDEIEKVYTTFVERVAQGRNLSFKAVDGIAGGRVWSGANAVENGLADSIGGLMDAIEVAAQIAGASDYSIWEVVDAPDNLTQIVRNLAGASEIKAAKKMFGQDIYEYWVSVNRMLDYTGVQARMPQFMEIR